MTRRVKVAADAAAEIERVDAWWRIHRTKNPGLFIEEVRRAFSIIRRVPASGRLVRRTTTADIRRWGLRKTGYALYYRYTEQEIEVVVLWSSRFGEEPEL